MSDPFLIVGAPRRGRPPLAPRDTRTSRIEVLVTEDERVALQKVASANRQTLSSVLRDAVNTFVADYGERVIFTPSGDRFRR